MLLIFHNSSLNYSEMLAQGCGHIVFECILMTETILIVYLHLIYSKRNMSPTHNIVVMSVCSNLLNHHRFVNWDRFYCEWVYRTRWSLLEIFHLNEYQLFDLLSFMALIGFQRMNLLPAVRISDPLISFINQPRYHFWFLDLALLTHSIFISY